MPPVRSQERRWTPEENHGGSLLAPLGKSGSTGARVGRVRVLLGFSMSSVLFQSALNLSKTLHIFQNSKTPGLQISAKDKSSQNWLLMPAQSNWESESTSAPTREIVRWTSLGVATIALTSTAFFFSESGQILGRTQDRLCLMRPALCGEPDTLQRSYPRLEYEKEVSAYNGQQALYYSSLGLTTVAFSVFASTFFFDWE